MTAAHLAAALAVVASCAALGQLAAARLGRRARELADLVSALLLLGTEIEYAATPLPQALRRVGAQVGGRAGELLAACGALLAAGEAPTVEAAWAEALRRAWPALALQAQDAASLLPLGSALGASSRSDQMRHLRLAAERMRRAEEEARREAARSERLWRYLGVGVGLGLVLLLW